MVGAICYLAIVREQSCTATSAIYKKYSDIVSDKKPLSYRRIFDLLVELDNSGLLVSRAYSSGRNGYGKEYKLKVSPELVGPEVNPEYFDALMKHRQFNDLMKLKEKHMKSRKIRLGRYSNYYKNL